jgi:hypothetical protein
MKVRISFSFLIRNDFCHVENCAALQGIAFIKDPTGYWIEILSSSGMRDFAA